MLTNNFVYRTIKGWRKPPIDASFSEIISETDKVKSEKNSNIFNQLRGKLSNDKLQQELGLSGSKLMAGMLLDEYNDALSNLNDRYKAYQKMRANATISTLETTILLPLIGARWYIDPAPGNKRLETKIADELERNLFEGMSHSWIDFLREALLAILFGLQIFEKVFEVVDGKMWWRKLASRPMNTLDKWIYDENGGVAGIGQRGWAYPKEGGTSGTYTTAQIPIDKLIIFTYRREGGSPEGRGIFRDVYQSWYYLNALKLFAAIRVERTACGTPYVIIEEGTSEEDILNILSMLQRLRTAEKSGAVFPSNVRELGNLNLGDPGVPFLDLIQHEEQCTLRTGLAHFVGLGQGENTGAFALSEDASSFFLDAENTHAFWFSDYFNRFAIRQWVTLNYGVRKFYPKLRHYPIDVRSRRGLAELLDKLYGSGLPDRMDSVGERVRELFGLPDGSLEYKSQTHLGGNGPLSPENPFMTDDVTAVRIHNLGKQEIP